jgi:hypothetical protein
MKSINTEVLLRNRRVCARARDAAFADAARLVDEIVARYGDDGAELMDPEELRTLMASLVDRFFHARYFARLSAGGNIVEPPAEIDYVEQAYIDHVETAYSYSRSINRFARHELLIDSFVREHPDVSGDFKAYLEEIRKSDANLIYINLRYLRERIRVFARLVNRPAAATVAVDPYEPPRVLQGG